MAPQMIQGLKESQRHDIKVVGVDAQESAIGRHFCDHFALTPMGAEPGYVDAIIEIAERFQVDLILPTSDEEALALAEARQRVESGERILACAPTEVVQTVSSKVETYRRLELLGVKMPAWKETTSITSLEAVIADFAKELPEFVIKPSSERGGRGVCVIRSDIEGEQRFDDRREIHMDLEHFKNRYLQGFSESFPVLVMERLEEPVHDLDMLAWKGEPMRVVARRRIDSAVPNEGHTLVDAPELQQLGEQLIKGFNLSWLYDCDVMYDRQGNPCVLEINPRQSGSVVVSIAAGVPLLEDVVSLAKGEPLPEVDVPLGSRVVPYKSLRVVSK